MTSATAHDVDYENAVAIIGMSGRFPGAQTIDAFWQNIAAGVRSIRRFSDAELLEIGIPPERLEQPNYVKAGTVIDEVDRFDAAFFGYPPREAELMDPQHRLFLECAWEALERAAYAPEAYPGLIGVFAGSASDLYLTNYIASHPELLSAAGDLQLAVGNERDSLASTVSYKLNLRGPSIAVQSFCSTSLVAVHLACQSLLTYECDIALAGGVAISVPQGTGYLYEEGGIVSPDGECRTFDANAQGSVMGNGLGVVALKRMEEALADGDHIYAVIRGSATNNDGLRKVGYTAPGLAGQTSVIVRALHNAGVKPETIDYIEAHGTATPLGDAVELAALIKAFEGVEQTPQFCALGSVKPNIGHLDRASGVTSLIKTTLALMNQQLPPSLNFESASPDIDLDNSPFYVNTQLRPWLAGDTPRRAGINSFGLGGTNAHVVLEEAPATSPSEPARPVQLLLLSTKTNAALERATDNLVAFGAKHPALNLADVAYTLQVGRSPFNHRRMVVARDMDDALAALATRDPQRVLTVEQTKRDRPVAFVLGGVGEHYVGLAQALYVHEPAFRATIDQCSRAFQPLLGHDLRTLLWPTDTSNGNGHAATTDLRALLGRAGVAPSVTGPLTQTALAQPAVFMVEYALAQLLMSWGLQPQALLGYSLGEYVAATLAGVISLDDALRLVATRAQLIQTCAPGAMLAVALPEAMIQPYLSAEVALAAVNGPHACVLAGPAAALDALAAQLTAQEIACRPVATTHAFHSPMLAPVAAQLTALAQSLTLHPPQIPYISNVTGTWITDAEATDPGYWARHLVSTVRFGDGIAALLERGEQLVIEVGPGAALGSFVKQHPACPRTQVGLVFPTLPAAHDTQDALTVLHTTLGKLWLAGGTIDWQAVHAHEQRRRVPLPTYPFERQRFWIDRQANTLPTSGNSAQAGKKTNIADWFYVPVWRQSVPLDPTRSRIDLQAQGDWLVFAEAHSLGQRIAEQLTAHGCTIVLVRCGKRFIKHDSHTYSIRPDQLEDYQRLLAGLDQAPSTILHLWSSTSNNNMLSTVESFQHAQQMGFYSLLYLVKALGTQLITTDLDLWVGSRGVYKVTGAEELLPEYGTLVGARTVISQENLNITCRHIDIDPPAAGSWQEQRLADLLLRELAARPEDLTVAYRGGERWTQHFEAAQHIAPAHSPLRPRGVYLITGGLGDIGLTLAEHFTRTVQARLILTTHGSFPAKSEWSSQLDSPDTSGLMRSRIERLRALESLGAEVLVVSADVADEHAMQAAVQQAEAHFGTLHGVIYTAGSSHPDGFAPIPDISDAGCEVHFLPKAYGLYVLEQVLGDRQLDFCVLFSSLAAVLGGLGFISYSAANSFMDAFAHKHNQRYPSRWISVNWDTWQTKEKPHGDMGTTVLEYAMTPAEGIAAFERIVATNTATHLVNSTGDFRARFDQWVRLLSLRATEAAPANLYPRPELMTTFVPPSNETEQIIADIWQTVLGLEVGIHDNFFELGGNSLIGTQIISRLRRSFQSNVSLILLFEAPTVAEMAVSIELLLIAEIEQLDEAEVVRLAQAGPELATGG